MELTLMLAELMQLGADLTVSCEWKKAGWCKNCSQSLNSLAMNGPRFVSFDNGDFDILWQ